jgi:hypothetical protein
MQELLRWLEKVGKERRRRRREKPRPGWAHLGLFTPTLLSSYDSRM